jgi:hypothetical protein
VSILEEKQAGRNPMQPPPPPLPSGYQQPMYPYRRKSTLPPPWIFVLIGILALFLVISVVAPIIAHRIHYQIGQSVEANSDWRVSVLLAKTTFAENDQHQPSTTTMFLLIDVKVENTSGEDQMATSLMWTLEDENGEQHVIVNDKLPATIYAPFGNVGVGYAKVGTLIFEVKKTFHRFTLDFSNNLLHPKDSEITIWDISV